MHNLYALHYNQAVFELLEEVQGKDAIVFASSTYASGQRFPVHWGGDCWSTFESMAESLRGGLSLTSAAALPSGATTSAASRATRRRPSTSAGSSSA